MRVRVGVWGGGGGDGGEYGVVVLSEPVSVGRPCQGHEPPLTEQVAPHFHLNFPKFHWPPQPS